MNKQESLELKGIAILMMLFLHLFNTPERAAECSNLLCIGDKPLALLLSRIGGMCVPIYIFISGYGLAASWQKQPDHRLHPLKRVWRLLGMYWTVFLLFIPLACYINPSEYPGSISEFFLNFFSLTYSYNGEWWFLRSYILMVFFSPWIIGCMMRGDKQRKSMFLVAAISYMVWAVLFKTHWMQDVYVMEVVKDFLHLYFSFVFGVWMFCTKGIDRLRIKLDTLSANRRHWVIAAGVALPLILCIVLKMMFLKAIAMMPLLPFYLMLHRAGWVKRVLCYFGHHSTYMWFTHSFFCYYLFHDYIYGLRYPALMFGALIVLALISSYVCQWVHDGITRLFSFAKK